MKNATVYRGSDLKSHSSHCPDLTFFEDSDSHLGKQLKLQGKIFNSDEVVINKIKYWLSQAW